MLIEGHKFLDLLGLWLLHFSPETNNTYDQDDAVAIYPGLFPGWPAEAITSSDKC